MADVERPLESVTVTFHVLFPVVVRISDVVVNPDPDALTPSPENDMLETVAPCPAVAVAVSLIVEYPCNRIPQPLTVLLDD